jgi:peptidoglycan hydrolase-like protein with peptidoglycan-binding domain
VRGLVADGVVGPATWAALEAAPSGGSGVPVSPSTTPSTGSTRPTVKRGATGEHVTYLQQRLVALDYRQVLVDGIFGPGTESAVRSFQRVRGLTIDGDVGPMTWSALG